MYNSAVKVASLKEDMYEYLLNADSIIQYVWGEIMTGEPNQCFTGFPVLTYQIMVNVLLYIDLKN